MVLFFHIRYGILLSVNIRFIVTVFLLFTLFYVNDSVVVCYATVISALIIAQKC